MTRRRFPLVIVAVLFGLAAAHSLEIAATNHIANTIAQHPPR